ncbi:putative helicase with zinc finger domain 2 isoform X4 [Apostichopus japonicus]|uniref:Putative helicase with zinc finger domain 2 isoform X4 n=1 Tax=Stichopus japonicus TaxID=307972 RepID=A0A2G8KVM0_STIJA|nr:putative helicase with zinc finger domain 2 isoform X4 [Apostichopus japonicus]
MLSPFTKPVMVQVRHKLFPTKNGMAKVASLPIVKKRWNCGNIKQVINYNLLKKSSVFSERDLLDKEFLLPSLILLLLLLFLLVHLFLLWQRTPKRNKAINGNTENLRSSSVATTGSADSANLMGTCSYSGLADDYNFCRFAHSEDELREWKERHRMKTQEKSYGYRQRDVKVTETQSPWTAMPRQQDTFPKTPSTQQIPSTTGSLGIPSRGSQVSSTPVSRATNQPIQPPPLQNTIPNTTTQTAAEISVPMLVMPKMGLTPDNVKKLVIRKPLQQLGAFKASYFHQWKFLVSTSHLHHLVYDSHHWQDLLLPQIPVPPTEEPMTPQAPWTKPHFTIVPYSTESQLEPFYQKLLDDYPPPPTGKITFQGGEGFHPSCFKAYLHKLIQLEEKTCNEKISKFCCSSELVLSSDLRQEQIYQSAQEGELFGTLKMNKGLTDNSDASQIVTKMAHFILIKFNLSSKVVYQSKIFYDRDNVLQQDDVIFVQIGQKCVQHEKLKAGLKVKVHVQFEVNRVNFCSMHYGVDHFNNIDLAFPPSGEPRFPKVRRDECVDMNPKQEAAARYIVGAGTLLPYHPGPTIISGPFGTGKTHAVAKIVMRLLLQSASSKILIATHTNSAADWYITEHLHPLLTRLSAVQRGLVLRIYATMVDPKRVNKIIRENYALLDGDGCFRQPQLADVGRCRIVIATLSTAIHLVDLGELHGRFTHIFIDEAGQALEAEVMIPWGWLRQPLWSC